MTVVLVIVALVRVVYVAGLVAVMLVRVALVRVVSMLFGVVLVIVALVRVVLVTGFVTVMFVVITLVNIVMGSYSHFYSSKGNLLLRLLYHIGEGMANSRWQVPKQSGAIAMGSSCGHR